MSRPIRPALFGKVAMVTGASSGIGEVTAREFAVAGARTVLAARRLERLEHLWHRRAELSSANQATPVAIRAPCPSGRWQED
jgi:NADP-dependent 3-hydroxy acid dehydrogenase YdfG